MNRARFAMLQARALTSRRFRSWSAKVDRVTVRAHESKFRLANKGTAVDAQAEKFSITQTHYTPAELGKAWGLSDDCIREIFKTEPGVLLVGNRGSKKKRRNLTMRIPESVAIRVHRRMSARPAVTAA
jgi:hypothetical protein